ncbi:coiled-coil domain-containing protein 63-like [Alosa sapidissima]|uniref:coiled-coil domain-containing protein 63-like n=1 Tax=Alosa sapidissima TaxID=34773 RepID=UPI001C08BA83|nr:coiled-coil domain-containing protein 63-like [Alosa sapidissima]XP_041916589.1 coiled-coil domain-containing protein 63-like [Alosa sapidissima]
MNPLSLQPKETLVEQHQRLLLETDSYVDLIRTQKEKVAKVEATMKVMQSKIWEKKKQMGGLSATLSRPLQQIKHIRILEDRLNQTTTRFDKQLSRNKALRDAIDHLCQQRGTLASMYHRLNKELAMQHHVMEELVEKSVQAYDQRSEALARMMAVRERSKKEAAQAQTEMTELQRVIDHKAKLRTFMAQKSQDYVPSVEDEEARKRRAEQSQLERMGGESLETYQAVHKHIVAITGERNLHKIANTFVENEEKSFAYFSYINELNNRSTMLRDRINKLKSEILHFEQQNKHHDEQWQGQLKELEAKLEKKRSEANEMEAQCKLVDKSLDQMKRAIADLFSKMKCDPSPVTDKLGSSAQVTDENVTQFIGIVEESLHNHLMLLIQSNFKRSELQETLPYNMLLESCHLLPTLTTSVVEPPSATSFEEAALDVLQGPGSEKTLDYKSLCECVMKRVVQTEQARGPKPASAMSTQKGKKRLNFSGPKSA